MLAWFPMEMTAVECPIQVYLILSEGHLNIGEKLIGSFSYNSSRFGLIFFG